MTSSRRQAALCTFLCIVVHSCSSPPPPLELPPVDLRVDYEPAVGDAGGATPIQLKIEILAVAVPVPGPSVQVQAVVIESETGRPFRGASRLPADSRWLAGDDAAHWDAARAAMQSHELQVRCSAPAIVAPGLTTVVVPGALQMPRLRLALAGQSLSVRLESTTDEGAEYVELRVPVTNDHAVLFVPHAAPHLAGHAIALHRDGEATDDAVAIARSAAHHDGPAASAKPAAWRLAIAAIGASNRRAALLALTQPLGLSRIVDLLLIADERALITITNSLAKIDPAAAELPWHIETAVWLALMPRLERDDVTPAMYACMRRQFGTLAGEPSALRFLLETSRDCASLGAAVREENLMALSDRQPTRRVHAHGWLLTHGGAVPEYDPLAPEPQRRAALRAHAAAEPGTEPER